MTDYSQWLREPSSPPPKKLPPAGTVILEGDQISIVRDASALKASEFAAQDRNVSPAALEAANRYGMSAEMATAAGLDKPKVDHEKLARENPKVAQWLKNPDNYAMARDNIEDMSYLERQLAFIGEKWEEGNRTVEMANRGEKLFREIWFSEPVDAANRARIAELRARQTKDYGITGFWEDIPGVISNQIPIQFQTLLGSARATAVGAASGAAVGAGIGSLAGGVGAIPGAATGSALGAGVGWRYGAGVAAARMEGSLALVEYMAEMDAAGVRTIDDETAAAAALAVGLVNGGLEMLGVEQIIARLPQVKMLSRSGVKELLKSPTTRAVFARFGKTVGQAMATEGITEFLQEMVTHTGKVLAEGNASTPDELIAQILDPEAVARALEAGEMGLKSAGGMAVVAAAPEAVAGYVDARRAEQVRQAWVQAGERLKKVPLTQQGPIEEMTQGAPNVFIPSEQWNVYWQSQGVDPREVAKEVMGSTKAYDDAVAAGADIPIPTASYARKIAATEHNAFFADELRMSPEQLSAREMRDQIKNLDALAEADNDELMQELTSRLRGAGFDAQTSDDYASQMAAALTQLSKRSGIMTPMQMLQKYGLDVSRAGLPVDVGASTMVDQGPIEQTNTSEFKAWFGSSKIVDENGAPLVVYHGTTGDFESFANDRANIESDWGAGLYFTNSTEDASENYAGEGPDLTNKIERLVEQYTQDSDLSEEEAREIAKEELKVQHGGMAMPVYLKMENPVYIGGPNETQFTIELVENEEGDIIDEKGNLLELAEALRSVAGEFYGDPEPFIEKMLSTAVDYDGLSAADLHVQLAAFSGEITDDAGNLAEKEWMRRAFEEMGFDGIIDSTVDKKFGTGKRGFGGARILGMAGVDESTVHYIAFEPTQIKSAVGNRGTFDPNDPSILNQGPINPDEVNQVRLAKDGRMFGGPEGLTTKKEYNRIVREMVKLAMDPMAAPTVSMNWYEESGRYIAALSHGDAQLQERMLRLVAFFSRATHLGGNAKFMVDAAYQLARGEELRVGRFPNAARAQLEAIFSAPEMNKSVPGVNDKVMSFYRNLKDGATGLNQWPDESTIDRWMRQSMGYTGGREHSAGSAQYAFARQVMIDAAKEISKKLGRTVYPRQLQAMLWTYERNTESYKELSKEARKSFRPESIHLGDYLENATAMVNFEAVPSTSTGLYPLFNSLPAEQKQAFLRDALALTTDLPTVAGIPLSMTGEGRGMWEGVTNPNAYTALTLEGGVTSGYDTKQAQLVASLLGYIYQQDAVLWHRPALFGTKRPKNAAVAVSILVKEGQVDPDTLGRFLHEKAGVIGFSQVVRPDGVVDFRALRLPGEKESRKVATQLDEEFRATIEQALNAFETDAVLEPRAYTVEYGMPSNDWKENPNGEGYLGALGEVGRPDLQQWADDRRARFQELLAEHVRRAEQSAAEAITTLFQSGRGEQSAVRGDARLSAPPVRADGRVELVHWSRAPGVEQLDPAYHGRGIAGAESTRKVNDARNWVDRTYYGLGVGQPGGYVKEAALGAQRYVTSVDPSELYDWVADPDGIKPTLTEAGTSKVTEYEKRIRDAGYKGYWVAHPQLGLTAAVFEALPVETQDVVEEMAQPAYHGSPHTFDEFKLQHIGTGEGAQAYGWGLYFSSKREVAEWYRDKLSSEGVTWDVRSPSGESFRHSVDGNAHLVADEIVNDLQLGEEFSDVDSSTLAAAVRALLYTLNDITVDSTSAATEVHKVRLQREINKEKMALVQHPGFRGATMLTFNNPDHVKVLPAQAEEMLLEGRPVYDAQETMSGVNLVPLRMGGTENARGFALLTVTDERWEQIKKERESLDLQEKLLQRLSFKTAKGRLYTVDIPEQADMLDWDKYMDDQPEISKKIAAGLREWAKTATHLEDRLADYDAKNLNQVIRRFTGDASTGQILYSDLQYFLGLDEEGVSHWLNSIGIPGLTYEGRTSSERNFVVFDDSLVKITEMEQTRRGYIQIAPNRTLSIGLLENADLSTFIHESGHAYLEIFRDLVAQIRALPADELTEAQKQMLDDADTITSWMGIKSLDEIQVEHHEQWARGFEAYAMEGKAPSVALRRAFARFRTWLVALYRSITGLNVKLNDDVRAVFDRMLASDEEIEATRNETAAMPAFTDAVSAGMSEREFAAYRKKVEDASNAARENLERKLMDEYTREREAWWQERKAEVQETVEQELIQRREYAARETLRKGKTPAGDPVPKLNTVWVRENRPEMANSLRPYTRKDGASPTELAPLFGFASGDELLDALADANLLPYRQAVEAETQRRMLAQYGDMRNDGTLADKAKQAVLDDHRSEIIEEELKAIEKLRRQAAPVLEAQRKDRAEAKRKGVAMLRSIPSVEVIRRVARGRVEQTQLKDLQPGQWLVAARRASAAAQKALIEEDYHTAALQKQRELLSIEMYREVNKAKERADNSIAYLRSMQRPKVRGPIAKAGQGILAQIDALVAGIDLSRPRRPQGAFSASSFSSYDEFIKSMQDAGQPANDDILRPAQVLKGRPYRELTVEELYGLRDAVKHLQTLARFKNKLLRLQAKAELDATAAELESTAARTSRGKRPLRIETELPQDRAGKWLSGFLASMRKMSSLAREMDGGVDGGPFWESLIRPLTEAADHEMTMRMEAAQKLQELLSPYLTLPYRVGAKVVTLTKGLAGTGMFKEEFIPEIGGRLSKQGRLMVALNWGNDLNRMRLMDGYGWNEAQVEAILDGLTEQDWQVVQGIWDLIDSYWPQIKALAERIDGVAPEKVEAAPVQTKYGPMRGGYFPIKYNGELSPRAHELSAKEQAEAAMKGAGMRSTTKHGFRKERVQASLGKEMKVRLDFGAVHQHLNDVIHDLTHYEALVDVNRVMKHPATRRAFNDYYGHDVYRQFERGIMDVAAGDVGATTSFERAVNHLRTGVSISAMGFNFMTSLIQPLGFTQSIVRIGPKWVWKGMTRWLRDTASFKSAADMIRAKSPFMQERSRTMIREINEVRSRMEGDIGIVAAAFWPIAKMQQIVDVPTWLGAYEKAYGTDVDMTEERAVALADQAVRDSQGGGQVVDLAQIQRGSPLMKLWTNFYSFFNVTYNLASESIAQVRSVRDMPKLVADFLMLYTVPAVLGYLLTEALRGDLGDEEPDELAMKLLQAQLAYIFGTVVGLRELGGAVQGYAGYEGPAGARGFAELAGLAKQVGQGEVDEAAVKAAANAAGILLHFPATQTIRSVEGMIEYQKSDDATPLILLTGPERNR